MATFTGSVNVKIYFGTKYDIINVPYNTSQIRTDATKTLTKNAQVVWQTTWLTEININVDDYQDIVGAQFVEIIDTGVSNEGSHWFEVLLYQQISKKTVRIGLAYDPLLSIGISHITGISGVLSRWSVNDDTAFKYTFSDEPINQIADYSYSYYRANPITIANRFRKLAGFPYKMTVEPEVIQYSNSVQNATIYVPNLNNSSMTPTSFSNDMFGSVPFDDGCTYYEWSPGSTAAQNYNKALSLGYDLVSSTYLLPWSSMISVTSGTGDEGLAYTNIATTHSTLSTGFTLYDGSYNNRKAGELGIYFSLYNEFTGDNVTVPNYNLSGTGVNLYCDATPNGRFYARFSSYLDDTSGASGLVTSPGYRSFTLTQAGNFNSQTNELNTAIARNVNTTTYERQSYDMERMYELQTEQLSQQATIDASSNTARAFQNLLGGLVIGTVAGNMIDQANVVNAYQMAQERMDVEYNASITQLFHDHATQNYILQVRGNLGKLNPPAVKYACTNVKRVRVFNWFTLFKISLFTL